MEFFTLVQHRIPQHRKGELIVPRAIRQKEEKDKGVKWGKAWPIFKKFHCPYSPASQFSALSPISATMLE